MNNGFQALLELAQTSRPGAGLSSDLAAEHQWRGIGFSLFGERFIAPVAEVAEMLELPSTTRLPGVQSWVVGVANVRGRLLPIFDLAGFYQGSLNGQRRNYRVLVIEREGIYAGLLVEHVYGMQQFPKESFSVEKFSSISIKERLGDCVQGSYKHNDDQWQVFSPAVLLQDPHFLNAALH